MIDRRLVRARARFRCEHCGIEQALVPYAAFHVEHVIPRKHGGGDDVENLALACFHCNLHKGPNLTGLDRETGDFAPLFHPRRQVWDEHFRMDGVAIVGLTPTGRVTAYVMNMNAPERIELRTELLAAARARAEG
ncbi:MAG: HNH endonuclease signature motif containing protein [Byssovorax sp.]